MAFSIDLKFIFVVSGLLTAQSPRDVFRYTSIKNRFHDLMPNKKNGLPKDLLSAGRANIQMVTYVLKVYQMQ
jgi:hypothetical protein